MNLKKMMQGLVFFLTSLLVFVFLFCALLPIASPRMTKPKMATKEVTYTYVALGDSLTEGVGDSTKQGGFVPILAPVSYTHLLWQGGQAGCDPL